MGAMRALAIGAVSGLLTLGIVRGSVHHTTDKTGTRSVRAPGGGRLQGQRVAFALQSSLGRVTARSLDGLLTLPMELSLLVDGEPQPLPIARLEPLASRYGLGAPAVIDIGGKAISAVVEFHLDMPTDALIVELSIPDSAALGPHTLALRFDLPSEGRVAFVSGIGEISDTAQVAGKILVIDGDPHPVGVVSAAGPLGVRAHAEEEGPPFHVAVSSPPLTGEEKAVSTDLRVVIGASGAHVWRSLYNLGAMPTARVAGVVTGATERARIFGLDGEGAPQVRALLGLDGRFDLEVPRTVVQWYAALDTARTSAPTAFAPGTGYDLRLDVSPGGELRVRILDGDTHLPITARLLVHGIDGTIDPSFGPDYRASGAGPIIDSLRGEVATPLPAGRYRVAATKGLEWSIDAKVVDIVGGHGVSIDLFPRHVVPTPGALGCDLHVHARPSFDTPVSVEDRVLSLVSAGIDFAVPTEHNIVGDYVPALETLHLEGQMLTVSGVEITTYSPRFGHFGLFPYPLDTKVPPYRHSNVNAVFNAAHRGDPNRILQVNHPRLPKGIGYFELFGYKPGASTVPRTMRTDFDSIEVYNGYDLPFPSRVEAVLRDYYALLNLGHHYVATGSSDSHRIQYQWAGYPRTIVTVGPEADTGGPFDPLKVVAQLKKGHATVTSGPIIEVTANGAGPGDEVSLPAHAPLNAHVVVRAAPWVDVTSIQVIVGGRVMKTIDVPSRPTQLGPELGTREEAFARTVRFAGEVAIPVTEANTWFMIIARGTRPLDDVLSFMPVPPLGLTNPIWITRSGTTGDKVPAGQNP